MSINVSLLVTDQYYQYLYNIIFNEMSNLLNSRTYTDAMGETVETSSLPYVGHIAARPLRDIFASKPTVYTAHNISWIPQPYTWKGITEKKKEKEKEKGIQLNYLPLDSEPIDWGFPDRTFRMLFEPEPKVDKKEE